MNSGGTVRVPQQGDLAFLANMIGGSLVGCYARLYSNEHSFSPTDNVSDYTEATFPGYTPQSVVWGTPSINSDGKAQSASSPVIFLYPGPSGGSYKVYGAYVTDTSLAHLYLVYPFLQPYTFGPGETMLPLSLVLTVVGELLS